VIFKFGLGTGGKNRKNSKYSPEKTRIQADANDGCKLESRHNLAYKPIDKRGKDIIVEQLGVKTEQVTHEAKFIEDLGAIRSITRSRW